MKPRKEVLALVGAAVVLAGAGYWYGTGDDTPPNHAVVQNEPRKTREQPQPLKGKRVQREQADTSDEVAPEKPQRKPAKVTERERTVRPTGEKVTSKREKKPAV